MRRCLACNSKRLEPVLNLGKQPLANNYGETKKYPLQLNGCLDCGHSQLSKSVSPKKLFSHYLYESGTSNTLDKWFADFADSLTYLYGAHTILDIASNDGSLLRHFQRNNWTVLGIDPAENLKPDDVPTVTAFFDEYTDLGKFDVITAFNVVAHTPNPLGILKGIRRNLAAGGKAYIMTSQGSMLSTGQFDTIYHEHHSFFTVNSMNELAKRAGLVVTDVSEQPIHGGSLLFTLTTNQFDNFKYLAERKIEEAKNFTSDKPVIGYGAAAKGVVFINATKLQLDAVVDEAELKQGYTIPGTDIPVVSLEAIWQDSVTWVILAWNFYDEIVAKIEKARPDCDDDFVRFF